ncbi:unnamed protein product [Malus baccata var. baccata]
MDQKVIGVPGMEAHLRRRDLPSVCRVPQLYDHPIFKFFVEETQSLTRVSALINTFDDLEPSILSHIATIGPLHALLKSRVWNMGIDLKDRCDRSTVEKMVQILREDSDQREQIFKSWDKFAKLARHAVSEGGSSCQNWEKLIHDLRKL